MAQEQLTFPIKFGLRSLAVACNYTPLGRLNLTVSVRLWGASEYVRKQITDGAPLSDDELVDVIEAMLASAVRDAREPVLEVDQRT